MLWGLFYFHPHFILILLSVDSVCMMSVQCPPLCEQSHRVRCPIDGGHWSIEVNLHPALQPLDKEVQEAGEAVLQHGVIVLPLPVVVHVIREGLH